MGSVGEGLSKEKEKEGDQVGWERRKRKEGKKRTARDGKEGEREEVDELFQRFE